MERKQPEQSLEYLLKDLKNHDRIDPRPGYEARLMNRIRPRNRHPLFQYGWLRPALFALLFLFNAVTMISYYSNHLNPAEGTSLSGILADDLNISAQTPVLLTMEE